MVIAGGDYIHFVVEYGGKIEKCRLTEMALLNRERVSRKDTGHAQLIAIFVRHRAEIEHLALAKLPREGHSDRGNPPSVFIPSQVRWPKANWSVQVVSSEAVNSQAANRAAIYAQHRFRHLLAG
ncbi:hypothetical protein V1289_001123 [Bradyrhizobium sp. AZCC 2289]